MVVDAFMSAGTKGSRCDVIFCRYTNYVTYEMIPSNSTSYYSESRMVALPPALAR